jgi:predicted metallo-beta-lactamase superfamily hydrolase
MNETDKLRVLIPHWIEHNQEHAQEFRDWAKKAGDASTDILTASEIMEQANKTLETALEKLGGPLQYDHFHQ